MMRVVSTANLSPEQNEKFTILLKKLSAIKIKPIRVIEEENQDPTSSDNDVIFLRTIKLTESSYATEHEVPPFINGDEDTFFLKEAAKVLELMALKLEETFLVVDPRISRSLTHLKEIHADDDMICFSIKDKGTIRCERKLGPSFPCYAINANTLISKSALIEVDGLEFYIENESGQLRFYPLENVLLNTNAPELGSSSFNILGNPKYPIPFQLLELFQIAMENPEELNWQHYNGLKKVVMGLIGLINNQDVDVFPNIAIDQPNLRHRMFRLLILELEELKTFLVGTKYHDLLSSALEGYISKPEPALNHHNSAKQIENSSDVFDAKEFKVLVPYLKGKLKVTQAKQKEPMDLFAESYCNRIERDIKGKSYWNQF